MGWVKGTVVAAGVLSASVAVWAAAPQASGQADKKEQDATRQRRERVIVTPQIDVFGGGPRLGVRLRDVDDTLAKEHKLAEPAGVLVDEVDAESAAEKGGIKAGDVITSFDGERVRSVRQLQRFVSDTPPNRQVKVGVVRDGKKLELTVTTPKRVSYSTSPQAEWRFDDLQRNLDRLGDLPEVFRFYRWGDGQAPGDIVPRTPAPGAPRQPGYRFRMPGPRLPLNEWTSGAGRLGVVVQEMTPQLAEYFGAKRGEGVLVASVAEGSAAAQAGIKAGDVITTVNGKAVADPEALLQAVRRQPDGQEMSLVILRDRKPQTLKVKLLPTVRGRPI